MLRPAGHSFRAARRAGGSLPPHVEASCVEALRRAGITSAEELGAALQTDGISLAPKIEVADAEIDWTEPAAAVDRRIRACTPAPGAWTTLGDERLKIGPVELAHESLEPGRLEIAKQHVLVGTGTTAVRLGAVKAFGKREMSAADWARGLRATAGATLGAS